MRPPSYDVQISVVSMYVNRQSVFALAGRVVPSKAAINTVKPTRRVAASPSTDTSNVFGTARLRRAIMDVKQERWTRSFYTAWRPEGRKPAVEKLALNYRPIPEQPTPDLPSKNAG